tara:strand:+ start:650 stop:847 length:198 start_codon:yes stop_codon:yes gene_type:complete
MIGTLLTFMMDVFMRTNYFKQFVKKKKNIKSQPFNNLLRILSILMWPFLLIIFLKAFFVELIKNR